MHSLHFVHGNLKGVGSLPFVALNSLTWPLSLKANIYIKNFRACIAGFSVSTVARVGQGTDISTGSTESLPSFTPGESLRWMSPELLDPSRLDDGDPRPTKESDCFALGMVIYEVRVREVLSLCSRLFIRLAGALWTRAVRLLGDGENQRCHTTRDSTVQAECSGNAWTCGRTVGAPPVLLGREA